MDDIPKVFHLGEKLFTAEDYANLYRTWDEYEVMAYYQTDPDSCLVAEANGRVVGFLLGSVIEKRRTAWNYGHLVWLGVSKRYQRYRVASRLFEEFREVMEEQGVRMLLVDTQADNVGAVRFFEKKGFTNPTEHVYMTLNLDALARAEKSGREEREREKSERRNQDRGEHPSSH